ncbi:MAG: hypothetical protein ACR2PG_02275 [Hyphomicrobiaceae bacterium]
MQLPSAKWTMSAIAMALPVASAALADTVTAKLPTVACYYHDFLYDRTGYDEKGRPTPELMALDTCKRIASGQKLELFKNQKYAPGGLRIVRIEGKLYFVRTNDIILGSSRTPKQ